MVQHISRLWCVPNTHPDLQSPCTACECQEMDQPLFAVKHDSNNLAAARLLMFLHTNSNPGGKLQHRARKYVRYLHLAPLGRLNPTLHFGDGISQTSLDFIVYPEGLSPLVT